MSDQERDKEEDRAKGYHEETSNTDNKSDLSPSARNKDIKDKIVGKISSTTTGRLREDNSVNLSESARVSNNVRTVILGLFVLIGFIVLVFAVFTASIGGQLNQVQFANSILGISIIDQKAKEKERKEDKDKTLTKNFFHNFSLSLGMLLPICTQSLNIINK